MTANLLSLLPLVAQAPIGPTQMTTTEGSSLTSPFSFRLIATDGAARCGEIATAHGIVRALWAARVGPCSSPPSMRRGGARWRRNVGFDWNEADSPPSHEARLRTQERFDLKPDYLAADTAYGSAETLN
jgi:hypothetical protein